MPSTGLSLFSYYKIETRGAIFKDNLRENHHGKTSLYLSLVRRIQEMREGWWKEAVIYQVPDLSMSSSTYGEFLTQRGRSIPPRSRTPMRMVGATCREFCPRWTISTTWASISYGSVRVRCSALFPSDIQSPIFHPCPLIPSSSCLLHRQ